MTGIIYIKRNDKGESIHSVILADVHEYTPHLDLFPLHKEGLALPLGPVERYIPPV